MSIIEIHGLTHLILHYGFSIAIITRSVTTSSELAIRERESCFLQHETHRQQKSHPTDLGKEKKKKARPFLTSQVFKPVASLGRFY